MLQYQLSMTLADMRIRDLVAEAERHALLTAARRDSTDATLLTARFKHMATRMLSAFRPIHDASEPSTGTPARGDMPTMASRSGAGPIGCSA